MLILLRQPLESFRKEHIFQKIFSACNDIYGRNIFKDLKEGSIWAGFFPYDTQLLTYYFRCSLNCNIEGQNPHITVEHKVRLVQVKTHWEKFLAKVESVSS